MENSQFLATWENPDDRVERALLVSQASCVVSRPRLLILDEPTEGIQPSIVVELRRALREVRGRLHVGLLLAEQFVDFATGLADEWCVLEGGGVALRHRAESIDHAAVRELLAV